MGSGLRASAFEPSGTLQFFAIYAPENRARLETGFSEEIARFVKDGVTAEELATAKKAMLAERTAARTNDGAVAGGWAARLEQGRVGRLRDGRAGALGHRQGPDQDEREVRRQDPRPHRR